MCFLHTFLFPIYLSDMTWMPVTSRRSTQTCSRSIWTLRWNPRTDPALRPLLGRVSKPKASILKSFSPLVMSSRRSSANLVGGITFQKPGCGVQSVGVWFDVSTSMHLFLSSLIYQTSFFFTGLKHSGCIFFYNFSLFPCTYEVEI